MWSGLSQFKLLQRLANEESLDDLVEILSNLSTQLLTTHNLRVAVNAEERDFSAIKEAITKFASKFARTPVTIAAPADNFNIALVGPRKSFIGIPVDINHCAMVLPTVPYVSEDHASLLVRERVHWFVVAEC